MICELHPNKAVNEKQSKNKELVHTLSSKVKKMGLVYDFDYNVI